MATDAGMSRETDATDRRLSVEARNARRGKTGTSKSWAVGFGPH